MEEVARTVRRAVQKWAKRGSILSRARTECFPFLLLEAATHQSTTTKFLEVKVPASAPAQTDGCDQAIEVRVQHGRSLLVAPGFDANHLRALLAVVESA